ncbi:MAG: acyl--CoA ligase [Deltaproteobacteria bacterium]|nr:acyl--CoA ligase [Deltaproteobacteria bacterium]
MTLDSGIYDRFSQQVRRFPEKTAVVFDGKTISYQTLEHDTLSLSAFLYESGIRSGHSIGVLLPNCYEYAVVLLAASRIGVSLVPQNMSLPVDALVRSFGDTGVKWLISWHSLDSVAKQILSALGLPQNSMCMVGGDPGSPGHLSHLAQFNRINDAEKISVDLSNPYIFTMTSGSTGDPKPITLSQLTKIRRAEMVANLYNVSSGDVILAATPLYHTLAERLVLMPLIIGATTVIVAGFNPHEWLDTVARYKVSFTMAVSSQLRQLQKCLQNGNYDVSSLRCLVSSSEALDANTRRDLIRHLKCEFHECYGTSEVSCVTNILFGNQMAKQSSVGTPLKDVDIIILSREGVALPAGQVGEIACRTPLAFSGYFNRPDLSSAAYWNGYFKTGDLGTMDSDGYLYFRGRLKEVVVTGGINVYPKDVEKILLQHPDVSECSVIPTPDERLGEVVTAVVVAKTPNLRQRTLQRFCGDKLADYQQPLRYYFVDALPKNPIGKINRRELFKRYSNGHVEGMNYE